MKSQPGFQLVQIPVHAQLVIKEGLKRELLVLLRPFQPELQRFLAHPVRQDGEMTGRAPRVSLFEEWEWHWDNEKWAEEEKRLAEEYAAHGVIRQDGKNYYYQGRPILTVPSGFIFRVMMLLSGRWRSRKIFTSLPL